MEHLVLRRGGRRPSPTRWLSLYFAQVEQQHLLRRLGLLIEFLMHDEHVNTRRRVEFAYRFRLCIESTVMWQEIENLISQARREWPVLSHALSPTSGHDVLTSISDILHDPIYIQACLDEVAANTNIANQAGGDDEINMDSDGEELPVLETPEGSDIEDIEVSDDSEGSDSRDNSVEV
ncbi:hypothetical protein QCA50_018317 [Cerrena zonata]|uniref:Uncharacterized protein n=1 Tax=Cerrena zonata TaxID=2478898 RepID=A0AAW0FBG4_9APHY